MKHAILQFLRDEQGATAIEYGLLAGLIAAVIAGTVSTLGTEIKTAFGNVCSAIKGSAC
ncbi:Flp family type IVb pilin [Ralstonia nicotianae]|uniref:Flp family type IVb pilin n=1 Tax=Ralstonia solanacearum species complex TaxID=3116862 RepID=UPI0002DB3313|nr:Flp family type IVb pilin [Ralstonia pseudosolanacearum]APF89617.1 pilus assembly protein [Ralstonia solanacearum FJAT-1458]AXV75148.1 Flp family type IVb pilin [Ralstonia solanacearum]AXW16867.1 Flp family type IVb pilin [Ralstonia solanacearum]AXW40996.1 Flp family type IVb pilin [Ralstonia solanacearum]AXW73789.1 Flp family type IVb pilin [Ralstonia solanacearum]